MRGARYGRPAVPGPSPRCAAAQAALAFSWAGRRWRPCGCTDVFSIDAPPRCFPEPPVTSASPPGVRGVFVSVRVSDMWEVTPL